MEVKMNREDRSVLEGKVFYAPEWDGGADGIVLHASRDCAGLFCVKVRSGGAVSCSGKRLVTGSDDGEDGSEWMSVETPYDLYLVPLPLMATWHFWYSSEYGDDEKELHFDPSVFVIADHLETHTLKKIGECMETTISRYLPDGEPEDCLTAQRAKEHRKARRGEYLAKRDKAEVEKLEHWMNSRKGHVR